MTSAQNFKRRLTALGTVIATFAMATFVSVAFAPSAAAVLSPIQDSGPARATADALPTVQVDGVVWSQVIAGSQKKTVWAGGGFANARPSGAAAGTNQTARSNVVAYNLDTGVMINFAVNPVVNGQVLAVTASPDGSRVYIAGDFTSVNGITRNRVAALNADTGALISNFAPNIGSRVKAIVATGATVYVGGQFTAANGQPRGRLAAYQASNGALTGWAPDADYNVNALTLTPDKAKVIVGGAFQFINGSAAYGLAAVDATNGDLLPFAATNVIRNAGVNAAIVSLTADATSVYGTGYHFGSGGNLEGTFSANPDTGAINWIEDCHGDTYSAYSGPDGIYTVSHAHYCGNIGGFPQSDPWSTNMRFALAFSKEKTGIIGKEPLGYFNWEGNPSPSMFQWFPDFNTGTYTGQNQAGWTVTGDNDYVLIGGEFTRVNGAGQQGLVRFATKSKATNKSGPVLTGSKMVPSLVSLTQGTVRVAFQSNWDRDDRKLNYRVMRNSVTQVFTGSAESTFWDRPYLGFTDSVPAGGDYRYRVFAFDDDGNQVGGDTVTITVPATGATPSAYSKLIQQQGASTYWRLGEASGTTAYDWAGYRDGVVGPGVTRGAPGAVVGDADAASAFNGASGGYVSSPSATPGPNVYTATGWFKTTTTSGGKIIGFGNTQTGSSSSYDRHVYMDNSGKILYGVYNGSVRTLTSAKSYNDGQWHQFASSLGPDGMTLYLDGVRVGQRSDVISGQAYDGYWRAGGDNLSSWTSRPTSDFLNGVIDDVAVFPTVLSSQDVLNQYTTSGRPSPVPPVPADTYGASVYNSQPVLYWRLGEGSGSTAFDSGKQFNSGSYRGTSTKGVAGALTGVSNTAVTFNGSNGMVSSDFQSSGPAVYSAEAWFKTSTSRGGKIIGFGSSQTGNSATYDRHVFMQNNGQLVFGGNSGAVTSPGSYRDNAWHHVVGTQDASALKLYVDGQLVGTRPSAAVLNYAGYWRVGGDTTPGTTSAYFGGTIDEAAVYPSALSPQQVANNYALGRTGTLPNQAPVADFTSSAKSLSLSVDGSSSSDADGSIVAYAWNFGDGGTATGRTASHAYQSAGTYTVTLQVTDDKGSSATTNEEVTVTAPPVNITPTAKFTSGSDGLTVSVDGSTSTDSDGSIVSYAWQFGDGGTGTGSTTSHVFATAGTFEVSLTVTDNDGATNSTSQSLTVTAPPPNVPPTAAFDLTPSGLTVTVDATASADSDGTIKSYSWNFGDSGTDTGAAAVHTYASAGTYDVELVITDDDGATSTLVKPVTVVAPPPTNISPSAAFTFTNTDLNVSFDASTSTDPDGSITSYAWDFGDGSTDTGMTISHAYNVGGTYQAKLTVTDNQGATDTRTQSVTVSSPVTPDVFAADNFERTVANGLGSAQSGGAWTPNGSASLFSVGGGSANFKINAAGSGPLAFLSSVSARDVRGTVDFTYDKVMTGGGTYTSAIVRRIGTSDYRVKVRIQPTSVQLQLGKVVNGAESTIRTQTIGGITWAPGDVLRIGFQAEGTGTTTLSGKVWKVGTTQPTNWQATATDSESVLQAPGAVGLQAYLAGSATNAPLTALFDNLSVGSIPATP